MTREELEQVIYERTRYFVEERVLDCILELIAAEREACARILDSVDNYANPMTAKDCAEAIRARGNKG